MRILTSLRICSNLLNLAPREFSSGLMNTLPLPIPIFASDSIHSPGEIEHRFQVIGNPQMVPGGEAVKNDVHILERMLKVLNEADMDRRSYVVVIGGGAVLDAVGFADSDRSSRTAADSYSDDNSRSGRFRNRREEWRQPVSEEELARCIRCPLGRDQRQVPAGIAQ